MESAYKKVDMSFCRNKAVFVETQALSERDIPYITSYVKSLVRDAGGKVVTDENVAQIKLTSFLAVSGTDDVRRSVGKDVVVGQVKGTLTVTDLASKTEVKTFDLEGVVQTKRNKSADTKILE